MKQTFPRPALVVPVIILVTLAIAIAASEIRDRGNTAKDALSRPQPSVAGAPKNENSGPSAALATQIDRIIEESGFANARWGVIAIAARDGHVIYARNADQLFTPASNMKVYTTAVALDLLGADYTWRTSVYGKSRPDANGNLSGDLTLYGRGAPDLRSKAKKTETPTLAQIADDLYGAGLRHVQGNVIGDESYFRADALGDGWQWNDVQWYFGAEPSALSINDNEVDVSVAPPAKADDPPTATLNTAQDHVRLINDISPVKAGEHLRVGIHRGLSDNDLRVWGEFPEGSRGFGARMSVHNPALWAARLFIAALKLRGITVDGEAKARDFRVPESERLVPADAVELAFVLSRPLGDIVKETNKESINLNAELILRTLGRERGSSTPDLDPHKPYERNDDQAGVEVIKRWLEQAGIATKGMALHDGSGLSRLDLVTPEITARLLLAIAQRPAGSVFRESLPIAGVDGTLGGRLHQLKDRVAAKTGSLAYDNTLSGYLTTETGDTVVFSVMCNDQTDHTSATVVIDKIVGALANPPH